MDQLPPAKTPSRYTGDILLRTRPKTFRRVVQLLAEDVPSIQIQRMCRVGQGMVDAIAIRQAAQIDERKRELVTMLTDLAHVGAARTLDTIGKATMRDAAVGMGIAVDKTLALLGQSPAIQIANVVLPNDQEREERRQLHDKLDAIANRLRERNAAS